MICNEGTSARRIAARIICAGAAAMLAGASGLLFSAAPASAAAPAKAAAPGKVFVLQGLPGWHVNVFVNDQRVGSNIGPKTVVGPMSLAAGDYQVRVTTASGNRTVLQRVLTVGAGQSIDAVVHLDAEATPKPKLTVFPNDTANVNPGQTRLAVAHTADVPPADIRVDGKVLFSNVANGEGLTTLVPAGDYSVDIVPTGTDGPAVLGPATFDVKAGTLTRVFAIGDPALHSMDAIVQVLDVGTSAHPKVGGINTGSGGRAATMSSLAPSGAATIGLGLAMIAFAGWRLTARASRRRVT